METSVLWTKERSGKSNLDTKVEITGWRDGEFWPPCLGLWIPEGEEEYTAEFGIHQLGGK